MQQKKLQTKWKKQKKHTYKQENVIEGEKKDQEVANAQKIRERALESFAETKKCNKYFFFFYNNIIHKNLK